MADERVREACLRNSGTRAGFKPQGVPNSSPEAVPYSIFETRKNTAKAWTKAWICRRLADSWTYRRVVRAGGHGRCPQRAVPYSIFETRKNIAKAWI